ncbi:uncharacterized protein KGF55_001797 [Candida pseudojiufengensis]|uniref:uncharacterized protein n=1 Tax=Candida pseudojiufengensis TaxID=497109 RepID=UPI00222479AF|nr:uncharacterized protein KGF55_001797 [Candida pseudojiufengensis]KAI5964727.1 hypothetical protein KGF55_001797 [Candida pseudojiufengensis]
MSKNNRLFNQKDSMSDPDLFRLEDPFMTDESIPREMSETNVSQSKQDQTAHNQNNQNYKYLGTIDDEKLNTSAEHFKFSDALHIFNVRLNENKGVKEKSMNEEVEQKSNADDFINFLW